MVNISSPPRRAGLCTFSLINLCIYFVLKNSVDMPTFGELVEILDKSIEKSDVEKVEVVLGAQAKTASKESDINIGESKTPPFLANVIARARVVQENIRK